MLTKLLEFKLPITTCTIYNPQFDNVRQQTMCETGLSALNDVIVTESTKVIILHENNTVYSTLIFISSFSFLAWNSSY